MVMSVRRVTTVFLRMSWWRKTGEKGLDLSELWRSRTSAHGPTGLSAPSTFRRWRRGGSARTSAPAKTAPAQDARGLGGAEEDRSLLKFLALVSPLVQTPPQYPINILGTFAWRDVEDPSTVRPVGTKPLPLRVGQD
uniref:Uncharacterized protein n=1 Tax=Timema tahoe TaxID=61484 RepID=A0A7R9NWF1_9NEOP|nr:unnamed protein product [Timema tahoe]